MDDRCGPDLRDQLGGLLIRDIGADEPNSRRKGFSGSMREIIQDRYDIAAPRQSADEMRADEAGTASDEDVSHGLILTPEDDGRGDRGRAGDAGHHWAAITHEQRAQLTAVALIWLMSRRSQRRCDEGQQVDRRSQTP